MRSLTRVGNRQSPSIILPLSLFYDAHLLVGYTTLTAYNKIREKYFNKSAYRSVLMQDQFYALLARLDRLEKKLKILIDKVIDEVNNGNRPKDLSLNEFFSTFCTLKAWDEDCSSAKGCKSSLNWFFRFLKERYPDVRNLRELTPIMISCMHAS